jgi:hypothetical protein
MLPVIIETCNIVIKEVDPLMKNGLINILPTKLTCLNSQSESDLLPNEDVDKTIKNKNQKKKTLKKTKNLYYPGSKGFVINSQINNVHMKTHQTNAIDNNQLKSKTLEFLNSSAENQSSKNSIPSINVNLKNLQNNEELQNYTQQLYQNILSNMHQQYNLHNITPQGLNRFFNQNHANLNCSSRQSPFRNPQTPPLLSLRPQITPENSKPIKQQPKMMPTKKK